MIRCST
ncbi:hypothetical protein AB3S75_027225 [Citrus x aurantiifolia]